MYISTYVSYDDGGLGSLYFTANAPDLQTPITNPQILNRGLESSTLQHYSALQLMLLYYSTCDAPLLFNYSTDALQLMLLYSSNCDAPLLL